MEPQIYCLILLTGSYLLGSISPAILVVWLWVRKDIRSLGNRNAGVTNVARSVGIMPAIIVVVADFAKGAIPVLVARWLGLTDLCALLGALLAVVGHNFPVFFRFRGGHGLVATLGALLVFTPFETLLVLPILGLVYLVITGSAVTGAIVALGMLMGLNYWRGYPLILVLAPWRSWSPWPCARSRRFCPTGASGRTKPSYSDNGFLLKRCRYRAGR